VAGFICKPIAIIWDSSQGQFGGQQCIDILVFNYYNAAFFILSDIFLAVVPVFVLKGMQMDRRRKGTFILVTLDIRLTDQVALSIMFSLGMLAIGGTISRQVTNAIAINNTSDFTW
jgi:hypothetical protein